MPQRGILLRQNEFQEIVVKLRNEGADAINWNKYATYPVNDPERGQMVILRNRIGATGIYVHAMQLSEANYEDSYCDVVILCKDGVLPCHSPVISKLSPWLKEVIDMNIKEIGIPGKRNQIAICIPDFTLQDVEKVIAVAYTGYSTFRFSELSSIHSLLNLLKISDSKYKLEAKKPEDGKMKHLKKFLMDGPRIQTSAHEPDPPSNKAKKSKRETPTENEASSKTKPSRKRTLSSASLQRSGLVMNCDVRTVGSGFFVFTDSENYKRIDKEDEDYRPHEDDGQSSSEESDQSDAESYDGTCSKHLRSKKKLLDSTLVSGVAERVKLGKRNKKGKNRKSDGNSRYPKRARKEILHDAEESEGLSDDPGDKDYGRNYGGYKCYFCRSEFDNEAAQDEHSAKLCGQHLIGKYKYPDKICLLCGKDFGKKKHSQLIDHVNKHHMNDEENKGVTQIQQHGQNPPRVQQTGRHDIPDAVPGSSRGLVKENLLKKDDQMSAALNTASKHRKDNMGQTGGAKQDAVRRRLPTKGDPNSPLHGIIQAEKVPLGKPVVVMERLSDPYIETLIGQIQRGDPDNVERVPGYYYVFKGREQAEKSIPTPILARKKVIKDEIPDNYPDDDDEMTEERLRQMEEDQQFYIHNPEKGGADKENQHQDNPSNLDKQHTAQHDPALPTKTELVNGRERLLLRIPKSIIVNETQSTINQEIIHHKLISCSCSTGMIHDTIGATEQCLRKRNLEKCWICGEELPSYNKYEMYNHLAAKHNSDQNPGQVVCPICGIWVHYNSIPEHMYNEHFPDDYIEEEVVEKPRKRQRRVPKKNILRSKRTKKPTHRPRRKNNVSVPKVYRASNTLERDVPSSAALTPVWDYEESRSMMTTPKITNVRSMAPISDNSDPPGTPVERSSTTDPSQDAVNLSMNFERRETTSNAVDTSSSETPLNTPSTNAAPPCLFSPSFLVRPQVPISTFVGTGSRTATGQPIAQANNQSHYQTTVIPGVPATAFANIRPQANIHACFGGPRLQTTTLSQSCYQVTSNPTGTHTVLSPPVGFVATSLELPHHEGPLRITLIPTVQPNSNIPLASPVTVCNLPDTAANTINNFLPQLPSGLLISHSLIPNTAQSMNEGGIGNDRSRISIPTSTTTTESGTGYGRGAPIQFHQRFQDIQNQPSSDFPLNDRNQDSPPVPFESASTAPAPPFKHECLQCDRAFRTIQMLEDHFCYK